MEFDTIYQEKLCTPAEIASQIGDGWSCCTDIAAAIPPGIVNALGRRAAAGHVHGVTLHTMLDLVPLDVLAPDALGR